MSSTSSTVHQVLEVDQKYRYDGVVGDLHPLSSLQSVPWDYNLPTLSKGVQSYYQEQRSEQDVQPLHGTFTLETNMEKFRARLESRYPIFENVSLTNLLLAGGFTGSILTNKKWDNDIDVFVHGLTPEEASQRVDKFIRDLYASQEVVQFQQQKNNRKSFTPPPTFSVKAVRNPTTLTLYMGRCTIQIIFRLYQSISEILHGFDLGSSAVGYDGNEVWTTSLGKFAYERGCNIVDPSRRSTTYEKRLEKYFNRDFEIILPDLDISRVSTRYFPYNQNEVLIMPHLQVVYKALHGNRITVKSLIHKCQVQHDYGEDLDSYSAFYTNVKNLVHGKPFLYHYHENSQSNATDAKMLLQNPPYMSRRMIMNFYDMLPGSVFKGGKFNYGRFFKYVNVKSEEEVGRELFQNKTHEERFQYVENLVSEQKSKTLQRWEEMENRDYTSINWITKSPGTQFTGSFNPVLSDPADWYGEFLQT